MMWRRLLFGSEIRTEKFSSVLLFSAYFEVTNPSLINTNTAVGDFVTKIDDLNNNSFSVRPDEKRKIVAGNTDEFKSRKVNKAAAPIIFVTKEIFAVFVLLKARFLINTTFRRL